MTDIVKTLGENIRALRKEAAWTQETLAEKAGISVPFMTQIELGRKTASLEVVENIAKALGVNYETLFKKENVKNVKKEKTIHVLEKELTQSVNDCIRKSFAAFSR